MMTSSPLSSADTAPDTLARLRTTLDHQVLTPLTVIRGVALTLAREDIAISDAARNALLNSLADQTERLQGVVKDILLAASVSLGSYTVQHAALNIDAIVRDRCRRWSRIDPTHSVYYSADAPRHEIVGDPECIQRVLDALLDNATRYSPPGSSVRLKVERPRSGRSSNRVFIAVEDHGRGILQRDREVVFEPLYRLDPDMREQRGGLGLSLFTARGLVRQMGGDLWAEDADGGGARFVVALPAKQPDDAREMVAGSSS